MKRAIAVVLTLAGVLFTGSAAFAAELFTPAVSGRRIATESVLVRNAVREVVLNRAALEAPDLHITLDGRSYEARGMKTKIRSMENSVEEFTLDSASGVSTLTQYHGAMKGWFWTPQSDLYEFSVRPDGYTTVQWVDPHTPFHCAEIPVSWPGLAGSHLMGTATTAVGSLRDRRRAVNPVQSTVIRELAVYNVQAMTEMGGAVEIEALIQSCYDQFNAIASSSGVDWVETKLVHVQLVDYNYPGDDAQGIPRTALTWAQNDPGIASLRKMYSADEVGVFVQKPAVGGGGTGFMPIADSDFVPSNGFFAVTVAPGTSVALVVSHELGHTIGLDHHVEDPVWGALVNATHPWAHGYHDPSGFQTLMSEYWPGLGWARFSNPALTYSLTWADSTGWHTASVATGSEPMCNNAKQLALGAPMVATYHNMLLVNAYGTLGKQ